MNCQFCRFNETYRIIKEYNFWTLILAESQQLLGWCFIVLNRHEEQIDKLTDDELIELRKVIKKYKDALNTLFSPDHFNFMQLGNMTKHIHIHCIPRYKEKREFVQKTFHDKDYGKMIVNRWQEEEKLFLTKLMNAIKAEIHQ